MKDPPTPKQRSFLLPLDEILFLTITAVGVIGSLSVFLVEFKIFNRWGELLFITNDLDKGWDGTYKGSAMPEGTYVFRAYLTDLAGRTSERSGTILLLRKGKD